VGRGGAPCVGERSRQPEVPDERLPGERREHEREESLRLVSTGVRRDGAVAHHGYDVAEGELAAREPVGRVVAISNERARETGEAGER
jgi:hypothetical protein